jgi:hypothetical protein
MIFLDTAYRSHRIRATNGIPETAAAWVGPDETAD